MESKSPKQKEIEKRTKVALVGLYAVKSLPDSDEALPNTNNVGPHVLLTLADLCWANRVACLRS